MTDKTRAGHPNGLLPLAGQGFQSYSALKFQEALNGDI